LPEADLLSSEPSRGERAPALRLPRPFHRASGPHAERPTWLLPRLREQHRRSMQVFGDAPLTIDALVGVANMSRGELHGGCRLFRRNPVVFCPEKQIEPPVIDGEVELLL
jgi:hypothetical protein